MISKISVDYAKTGKKSRPVSKTHSLSVTDDKEHFGLLIADCGFGGHGAGGQPPSPLRPFDHAPRDSSRDRQGRLCSGLRRAREDRGRKIQDARCTIQDAGCWIWKGIEHRARGTGYYSADSRWLNETT